VRVIAGKYKGRKLFSPSNSKTVRPTTDRVKETLFSILYSKGFFVSDCYSLKILDLFCGSGALGIEALSRGATDVIFVDKSKASVELCRRNLKGITTKNWVICADFSKAIKSITAKESDKKFDIIFLDPPYHEGLEAKAISKIIEHDILDLDGVIVVEHDVKNTIQAIVEQIKGFKEYFDCDSRIIGDTILSFLQRRTD